MGRPLNKKYFGNRNIGTNGYETVNPHGTNPVTGDDGIGGEGLAAYTLAAEHGSVKINIDYPAPYLVIPEPTIPGGVQATAQVIWEVDHISLTSSGSDYETSGFPVNATFTGLGGGVIGRITSTTAGADPEIDFTTSGANRGEFINTPPTSALTYEVCSPANPSGGGNNAQCEVFFRIKSITTVQKGSGYIAAPTITWHTAGSFGDPYPGAPTVALTTDSGPIYSSTNQENAIIIHANTDDMGTKVGDIIKQLNDRRYKVKTDDGTAKCILVADESPNYGEAYIKATDDNGNTYFVYKLTSRVAVLSQWEQNGSNAWLFAEGARAKWTLNNTFAPDTTLDTVVIENA